MLELEDNGGVWERGVDRPAIKGNNKNGGKKGEQRKSETVGTQFYT